MVKHLIYITCFLVWIITAKSQLVNIDSLKQHLEKGTSDTSRILLIYQLAQLYSESKPDSSVYFANELFEFAGKKGYKLIQAEASLYQGYGMVNLGNYAASLDYLFRGLKIANDRGAEKDKWRMKKNLTPRQARMTLQASIHLQLGYTYNAEGNIPKSLEHYQQTKNIAAGIPDYILESQANSVMGSAYLLLDKPDSALYFESKALDYNYKHGAESYVILYRGFMLNIMGDIYFKKKDFPTARHYYALAVMESEKQKNFQSLANADLKLAKLYKETGNADSARWYALKALKIFKYTNTLLGLKDTYSLLADIYKSINEIDSAFYYQQFAMSTRDSLISSDKIRRFQNIVFEQQLNEMKYAEDKKLLRNRFITYALVGTLVIILAVALILSRNNRQKQKVNLKLNKTLADLKLSQDQLVRSEKMASLGELTSGIAHEIQNPLNFVNNFSEVSSELVEELKTAATNNKIEEAKDLITDLGNNLEKINHHGKRADAIVKSMLQHSRTSSGKKELTDINLLADEYLRLSYYGWKAKDKSFDAVFQTTFDPAIDRINIVPQEIGRVLLNLTNNAFYTVNEKAKLANERYQPQVSLMTEKKGNQVLITLKDNGLGISSKNIDKLFQPFFTTKPTGQGTGLGLSLSYDIIKVHGGDIKVNSREGEFTEIVVSIPIS